MKAVIMAAGKSLRTHPLTADKPKPLLRTMNKTTIEHNLEQLQGLVDEAVIIIGFMKEMIKEKLGDSFGKIKITYVEQKEQLGPGHAVMQARDLLDKKFIVMNGDDYFSRKDMQKCIKHRYCVLAQKVSNPGDFGVFVLEGKNKVEKIVEKPRDFVSDLANTGFYVFDEKIFEIKLKKTERGEYEITDYVTELAKNNEVYCETVEDYWFPISFAWSLLDANSYFVGKLEKSDIKGKVEDGVTVKGNIAVGEGSVIMRGVYIEGNVVIGKGCRIGPNCYLRGNTTVGDRCRIGQAVEIKNSIIGDKSNVPHLSYVGDSVIGDSCNLGAGTITANLRHDNGNVKSVVGEKIVDSGRRKLGAVIGDNVHTGINTMIYPGRKIWPNKTTVPGEIIKKDIR